MRCAWAALVAAACAAAQNEAVAALVAKYKKSAGGSPAATCAREAARSRGARRRGGACEAARRGASGDQRRCEPKRRRRALRVAEKTAHRLGRREGRDHGPARSTAHLPRPPAERARYIDKHKRRRRRLLQEMAPRRAALRAAHAGQLRLRRAERRHRARARHEPGEERRELQTDARRFAVEGGLGLAPKRITRGPLGQLEQVYTAAGPTKPRPWPTFAIGKREPHRPGLLMPNPFFGAPSWWARHNLLQIAASQKRSWATRLKKVLYRGACGPGARARLELMNLAESSDLLDVGFTGVDGFPSIQSCVDALAKKHEIRAAPSASRRAPHVAQTNYSQYRYLLHLPGAATGSYSRNLQYLWTHGSIVLVWNQTATEFYYRHLQNDVHYVVVDASNIVETVEAIEADPARQERLRRGARAFYDAHLAAPRLD